MEEIPVPQPPYAPKPVKKVSRSYSDDLSQAMKATDPAVVQELLEIGKAQEEAKARQEKEGKERGWYVSTAVTLFFFAVCIGGYALYHYFHLTVPVQEVVSVGAFPSTEQFVADQTSIEEVVKTLKGLELKENTPFVVPITTDDTQGSLLSVRDFLDFAQTSATEPFVNVFDAARLGVMNINNENITFIIGSVKDPTNATKEFLIAEPDLLRMFYRSLDINTQDLPPDVPNIFTQGYKYNLPVRVLNYTDESGFKKQVFLYGFATNQIIVITTDERVLKAVSDTIIGQQ